MLAIHPCVVVRFSRPLLLSYSLDAPMYFSLPAEASLFIITLSRSVMICVSDFYLQWCPVYSGQENTSGRS